MKCFVPPTRVGCFLLLVVAMVHCIEPSNPATNVGSSSYAKVKYANGQKNNTYRFAFQRDPTIQYVSAEDLRPKPAFEDHQVPQITPEEWKTVTDSKKIVVGSSKSSSVSVQTSDNHRYYPTTTTEHQLYETDPVEDHADQPDMWMQSSNEEGEVVLGNNFEKQPTTELGQQNWGSSVPSSSSSVSMSSSVSSSSGTSGTQSQNTPLYEPHHSSDSSDGQFSSETQGFRTTSSTEDPFGSDTAEYAHASDDNLGHLVTDPTPMTTTTRATTRTVITTPTTTTTNTVTPTTTSRKKTTTTPTEPTYITDSHFSGDNVQAKTELPPQMMTQRPPRPPTERKDDQTGFSIFAQELAPGTGAQSAWRPFVGPPVKQVVSKKRPFNNRPVTLLINEATTDAPPPLFFKDPLPGSAIVGDNIQFGNNQGGTGMALFVPAPDQDDERVDTGVFGTIVDTHRPQFMQKPFSVSPGQGPRPTPSGPLDLPPPSRDRIPQRPLQATAPRPPGLVTPGGKGDLDIEAILKDLKKKIPNGPVQINPQMVMNGNGGPPNRAPPQFQQRPQFQNQPPPPPPNFQGRPPQGFGPQSPPPQGFNPQGPPQQGFGPQGPPQQGQINGRPFIMNNSPNGPARPGFNPQVIADRNDVPGATFFNPQQQNNRFPESNMIIPPNQQRFPPNFRPPMMRPQFPPQQQQQQPSSGNFFKNLWSRLFGRSLENPEDVPIVDVDSLYNGTLPTEIYQHLANSTYAEAVDTLSKLGYGNFTFTEEPTISNSTEAN